MAEQQYVKLPDGSLFPVKENEDPVNALIQARQLYPDAFGEPKAAVAKKTGLMADVGSSVENLLNIGRTGIAALTGDTTAAAQAGAAREKALAEKYEPTFQTEKITKPFEEGQYGTAALEAVKSVPGAVAQLAPSVAQEVGLAGAGRLAGGALGALTPIPGGAAIGAQIGQYAVPLIVNAIQALGSQAQEKVQEQVKAGEKPDVSAMELAPYATANAALNLVGTRIAMPSVFKKAIGQKVEAEAGDAARAALLKEAEEVAGRGTAKAIGMGVGKFAFGELPTEVLQDIVDRAAVGKPLADDDAFAQYRSTALSMVLASPIGGGFGVYERAGARKQVEQQKKAEELVTAQQEQVEALKVAQEQAELAAQRGVPAVTAAEESGEVPEGFGVETKKTIDKLSSELRTLQPRLEAAVQGGDMTAAEQLQKEIGARQQAITTLSEALPPEAAVPPEQRYTDTRLQSDYNRLVGTRDENGNPVQGLYTKAVMSGDMKTAQQHLEQIKKLQTEMQRRIEKARPNIAAQQQLSLLQEQEQQVAPDIQTLYPEGGIQNMPPAPTIAQAIGVVKAATPENYQYGRVPFATQIGKAPAAPKAPTTLDMQQEGLFADYENKYEPRPYMEPGGSAALPIEEVQAKIEQLRNRPNTPAATLQQLDNYAKVLENPALADPNNTAAQNAFEVISENVYKIANAGFGQGAPRTMSAAEVKGELQGLYSRANELTARMAQLNKDMGKTADPQERERLSNDYALARRSLRDIEQQIGNLREQGRTTETLAYNQRPTQLVPLPEGPTSPFREEASETQIERTKARDLRGREAAPVSPYPLTRTAEETTFRLEPGEDGEVVSVAETAPVERIVPASEIAGPPKTRAQIERGGKQTIGVTREGPSDADLQQELAALTPEDQATLDLWDPVFGEGSPTRQLVTTAEAGLRDTQQIVTSAEEALAQAQKDLEAREAELKDVIEKNPLRQQAKYLEGELLQKERALRDALRNVETAGEVNKVEAATAKTKVDATDAAVAQAQAAYDAAKAEAEQALAKFNEEWDRLRDSGRVSKELIDFVTSVRTASAVISMETREAGKADTSLRTALVDAQTALNEVLARSEAKDKVEQINELLKATEKRMPSAYNTNRAYNLLQDVVPQIRQLMGPRVAALADTVLRIRLAERVIGKAIRLENAADKLKQTAREKERGIAEAIKEAKKAVTAQGASLSQQKVRMEMAAAKADAIIADMDNLKAALTTATEGIAAGTEAEKQATQARDMARTKVESAGEAAAEARRMAPKREAEARANITRAQQVQAVAQENRVAAIEGRPLPILQTVADAQAKLNKVFANVETSLQQQMSTAQAAADAITRDNPDFARELRQLQNVEEQLTRLLTNSTEDYVGLESQIADLIETSDLLIPSAYDENLTDATRVVAKAETAAQARRLAKEEANVRSARDKAIGALQKLLDENTAMAANPQSANHAKMLDAQRARLVAQIESNNKLFSRQIAGITQRRNALAEELVTAPDPDSKGYAREQLANLTASKNSALAQIQQINAKLDQLGKSRDVAITTALNSMGGANVRATMQSMGLKPTTDNAKNQRLILNALGVDTEIEMRKKLMESLAQQREIEQDFEKRIAEAKAKGEAAKLTFLTATNPEQRQAALRQGIAADEAYAALLKERADMQDLLADEEREQLRMVRELSDISFRQRDEADIPWNSTPLQPAGTLAQTAALLESGAIKGPAAPEVNAAMEAFADRVNGSDNLRGLSKELGQLKAQYATMLETAQKSATEGLPKTLTLQNAAAMRPNASPFAIVAERARLREASVQEQRDMLEKITIVQNRLAELRGETVAQIAEKQTTGRRGPVQKNVTVAGSFRTGTAESAAGELAVGTRNKPVEPRIEKQPSTTAAMRFGELFAAEQNLDKMEKLKNAIEAALDSAMASNDKARIPDLKEKLARVTRAEEQARNRLDNAMAAVAGRKGVVGVEYTTSTRTRTSGAVREAILDGRLIDAVERLAVDSSNPLLRETAGDIRKLLLRTKVAFDPNLMVEGKPVAAGYDPTTNTVIFRPDAIADEDIIHEAVHAATLRVLRMPEDQLTPRQLNAKREIEAIYNRLAKNKALTSQYGMKNIEEFVSEMQSNVDFRAAVNQEPWYQRFWQAFTRLFSTQPPEKVSDQANRLIKDLYLPSAKVLQGPKVASAIRAGSALQSLSKDMIAQPKTFKEKMGNNIALEAEMQGVDMRAGLREALKYGDDKLFKQAMYNVLKADQKLAQVFAVMDSGTLELYKDDKGFYGVRSTGKDSGKDVLKAIADIPLGTAKERIDAATTYMAAYRALNKGGQKLGIPDAKLRAALAEVDANPALKTALERVRQKYNAYNEGMVKFLAATQAISKKTADELLRDGDYVPFYRVRDNGMAELVFSDNVIVNVGDIKNQPYLRELKGGEDKIMPLNESLYRNTLLLTDKALTNMAQKSVAYGMQALGKGKGEIDPDTGKRRDLMAIHKGDGPDNARVFRFNSEPDPSDKSDTGKRWIEIDTKGTLAEGVPAELVVKSMEGAHLPLPAFLKVAGAFSDVLRSGVTRMPPYILRQLIRDPMAASFTAGLNYGPLRAVAKAGREFVRQYRGNSTTAAKLIEKGLIQSGIFTGDADDVSKIALQLADNRDQSIMNKVFAAMDKAALRADASTRALVYENAIANGLSEVEADMMTMESMNFYKRGLNPMVQYGNRLIPFLNAQIQGLNVLYKAATGKMPFEEQQRIKQKFFNNATFLFGLGLMYALAMEDDETFKNARPRDKYTNFFLHLPGVKEPIKIPTPFEAGYFFSAAVAAVDAMKAETNTKEQFEALRDMFLQSVPGWSSRGVPQIAKPVFEVWTNKNFMSGAPIETLSMSNKDIEDRYTSSTTEFAKALTKAIPLLSPVQIEHITRAYLGVGPLVAFSAANSLFAPAEKGQAPEMRASELPFFGSMFQKTYGGADSDTAFRLAKEATDAHATYNKRIKEGRREAADEYFASHKAEIRASQAAGQYRQAVGRINLDMERVRNRADLTPAQKRERLNELEAAKQERADRFLERYRAIESRA